MAGGTDLASFIRGRPQLPFLRPTVRAFVATLRVQAPASFVRQLRTALGSADIAYHLRRAIVETFAEMAPAERDWSLVRFLFLRDPDLFQRWLFRVTEPRWLSLLEQQWLPLLGDDEAGRSWRERLLRRLQVWLVSRPETVVALYRRALAEGWCERVKAASTITFGLYGIPPGRGPDRWLSAGARLVAGRRSRLVGRSCAPSGCEAAG